MGIFGLMARREHERLIKLAREEEAGTIRSYREARDEAHRKIGRMASSLAEKAKQVDELMAEIARLKPLAEATERRRANDANRVRPSRSKKAAEPTKPAAKAPAKKAAR